MALIDQAVSEKRIFTYYGNTYACNDIAWISCYFHSINVQFDPSHEKTNNFGFRPGPTQTGLYSLRSRLEA